MQQLVRVVNKMKTSEKEYLLSKHQEIVGRFKSDVIDKASEIDPDSEHYWESLAYGYFIAAGILGDSINTESPEPYYDARILSFFGLIEKISDINITDIFIFSLFFDTFNERLLSLS